MFLSLMVTMHPLLNPSMKQSVVPGSCIFYILLFVCFIVFSCNVLCLAEMFVVTVNFVWTFVAQ